MMRAIVKVRILTGTYLLQVHRKKFRMDGVTDTPASNLGYLAPPGKFSWVPNCSFGPPGCETKVSSKNFGLGYVKLHGFYGNP